MYRELYSHLTVQEIKKKEEINVSYIHYVWHTYDLYKIKLCALYNERKKNCIIIYNKKHMIAVVNSFVCTHISFNINNMFNRTFDEL